MNNFLKRLAGLSLGLLLTLGVGAAVGHHGVVNAKAASGDSYTFSNTSGTATDCNWKFETAKNSGSSSPAFNTNSSELRLYPGNSITFTALNDCTLTKATFTNVVNKNSSDIFPTGWTTSAGTITTFATTLTTFTVEGIDASSFTITINGSVGNVGLKTVKMEYTSSAVTSPLKEITLSEQTTEYYVGDKFGFTGVCTATFEDESVRTVVPTTVSSPDMTTAGEKTVDVSYADPNDATNVKTASYKINVIDYTGKGTAESPYTVKDAVHKAGQAGATVTADSYYVKGEIKKITTAFNSKYGNMSFTVGDDTTTELFTFYRCVAGNGVYFTDNTAKSIVVGDIIVGCGKILKYGTTCEFNAGCYPVDYKITAITASTPTVTDFESGQKISSLDDLGVNVTANVPVTGEVRDVTASATVEEKTLVAGENTIKISYTQSNKYTGDKTGYTALETTVTITAAKSASDKATEYANTFLTKTNEICGDGVTEKTGADLETLKTAWNELKTSYDSLDDDTKNVLIKAEAKNDGTVVEKAMARHDHIVNRYGLDKIVADRTTTSGIHNVLSSADNSLTITIIVLVSVLSVSLIVGTSLIVRKRKAN